MCPLSDLQEARVYQAVFVATSDEAEAVASRKGDEATVFGWWFAQIAFFLSGFLVTANQFETNWGSNDPRGLVNALPQYGGMFLGGYVFIHVLGRERRATRWWPLPMLRDPAPRRAALTMALPDLAAVPFQVYGLMHTGSGIFIVIFAAVTIWVAWLRMCFLRKGLRPLQWAGIVMIVGGQAIIVRDGTDTSEEDKEGPVTFAMGCVAIFLAAFLDAVMYVFTEVAANKSAAPRLEEAPAAVDASLEDDAPGAAEPTVVVERLITEDESCCLVGFINFLLAGTYVTAYASAGKWGDFVSHPIHHSGGSRAAILGVWLLDAALYYAHYGAFYYCESPASRDTARNSPRPRRRADRATPRPQAPSTRPSRRGSTRPCRRRPSSIRPTSSFAGPWPSPTGRSSASPSSRSSRRPSSASASSSTACRRPRPALPRTSRPPAPTSSWRPRPRATSAGTREAPATLPRLDSTRRHRLLCRELPSPHEEH